MYVTKESFMEYVGRISSENANRIISETNVLGRGCVYEVYDDGSIAAIEWEDGYQMFSGSDLYYEKEVRVWPDGHWKTEESNGNWKEVAEFQGEKEISRNCKWL